MSITSKSQSGGRFIASAIIAGSLPNICAQVIFSFGAFLSRTFVFSLSYKSPLQLTISVNVSPAPKSRQISLMAKSENPASGAANTLLSVRNLPILTGFVCTLPFRLFRNIYNIYQIAENRNQIT